MALKQVTASFTIRWSVHDSWSESYVGVRRLVYEMLPPNVADQVVEDSALCQLAIVGANHLMEVALFKLLQPFASAGTAGLTAKLLDEAGYVEMLTLRLPAVTGKPVDLLAQPITSTECLRRRRNATVHKSSAFATVKMARSALFSAVEGCRFVYSHAGVPFMYESFIKEYPIPTEPWFSDVPTPPET